MRLRSFLATILMVPALLVSGPAATAATPPAITWQDCNDAALDAAGAQCGTLAVPLDHGRPDGPTISVALARIAATDPAGRRGVLMVNPGGPGSSGRELVLAAPLMPEVAARYDIVGMDPRFVGASEPIECRWRTDTFVRSAGPDLRSYTRSASLMRRLAAGCADENLAYATTRNTARDMDRVRAALGVHRISYLGFSYGTYLGAVYLQMFGAELRAMLTGGGSSTLDDFLRGFETGDGPATDRAGTPILCADRPAVRDVRAYYRDIEAHRAAEPLFGPMTRNITPCAFWPVRGSEPATTIRNDRPALIVGADGDPATPYPGQRAMHRALTGSRMVTLRGGFGHGQYLQAGNACIDETVARYLTGGEVPGADVNCRA